MTLPVRLAMLGVRRTKAGSERIDLFEGVVFQPVRFTID
jgi:hypothetical protein